MMTAEQFKSLIERIVLVALTWAVTKGYLTPAQVTEFAPLIVAIAGAVYAWWINRPKALMVAAAASAPAGTLIVTSTEMAKSTPASPNIVSDAIVKVNGK